MKPSTVSKPAAFDAARPDLVRPVRVDPKGRAGPTRAQARGTGWRVASHGFYVPTEVDGTRPEQRVAEAGHYLRHNGSVTGWAALRWLGAEWFDGFSTDGRTELPVHLAVIHGVLRSQQGIHVTSEFIPPGDRQVVDGLRVTTPRAAVAYEMRYAPSLRDAVRSFNLAAAADLVSKREMQDYIGLLNHWTGVQQCRDALPLLDENCWSPQEVALNLVWRLDAELPPPLTNRPVFDLNGRHLATPDLLDPEAGVVGEYDGRLHLLGSRRALDLRREDDLRGAGLEYFSIVAEDRSDTDLMVGRMLAARERATFLPPDQRRWTIEPPSWWVPTHTVELRRALTPAQRDRFLGYRRTG